MHARAGRRCAADDRVLRRAARLPGRSTSALSRPSSPCCACARRAYGRSSASRFPPRARPRSCGALDFASVPATTDEPVADAPAGGGLDVTVPALRRDDVTREVDLIEEVARIDGVDRLPATLPARRGAAGRLNHAQHVRREAEDVIVGRGLYEVVGWSFTEPSLLDRLLLPGDHEMRRVVRLENPLSDAQSIMRPTLLGSLLDAARHNVARNGPDVAIFESGTVYRAAADGGHGADEHHALGALLSGALAPRSWQGAPAQADFFAAKALLAALLDHFHVHWSVTGAAVAVPASRAQRRRARTRRRGQARTTRLRRRAAPARRCRMGPRAYDCLRRRPRQARRCCPRGSSPSARSAQCRRYARISPSRCPMTYPRATCCTHCARPPARCSTAQRSSTSTREPRSAMGGARSRSRLTFRADDRTLTDEDVAPVRERIVAALGRARR